MTCYEKAECVRLYKEWRSTENITYEDLGAGYRAPIISGSEEPVIPVMSIFSLFMNLYPSQANAMASR